MQGICNVLPGRPRRRVDDSGGQGWLDRPEMGGQPAYHEPKPSVERPLMTHEHDHDTVVVEDSGGSGMGAMLGVIAIIVLLAAIWFFALGPGTGSTTNNNTTNNNNGGGGTVPAESLPAVPASS
jgi:hypothetical protein